MKKEYENKALQYAEKYGIIEYKVKNNEMIFYTVLLPYLTEPKRKYKSVVNLDTMQENKKLLYQRK